MALLKQCALWEMALCCKLQLAHMRARRWLRPCIREQCTIIPWALSCQLRGGVAADHLVQRHDSLQQLRERASGLEASHSDLEARHAALSHERSSLAAQLADLQVAPPLCNLPAPACAALCALSGLALRAVASVKQGCSRVERLRLPGRASASYKPRQVTGGAASQSCHRLSN